MTSVQRPYPDSRASRSGRVRAGDADRERVATLLAEHYSHGRLSLAEFDERTTLALGAIHHDELEALLADLPGASPRWQPVPRASRPAPPRPMPRSGPPLVLLLVAVVVLTRGAALWLLPLVWWFGGAALLRRQHLTHHGWVSANRPPPWRAASPCRRSLTPSA